MTFFSHLSHLRASYPFCSWVRSCFFWTAVWYSTISTWYSLFSHSLLMDTFVSLAVNSTTCIAADILVRASLCKSVSISQHTCVTELCSPDHCSACIRSSLIPNSVTRRCLPVLPWMFLLVPLVLTPSLDEGHSPGSYWSKEMGDMVHISPTPAELQVNELENKCLLFCAAEISRSWPRRGCLTQEWKLEELWTSINIILDMLLDPAFYFQVSSFPKHCTPKHINQDP